MSNLKNSSSSAKASAHNGAEESKSKSENVILNKLSIVTDNLETYQGRDTVITLFHYIALILADLCTYFRIGGKSKKKNMSHLFVNMFVQLSNCRVMLRLFDDFSAIREYYRFFKDEKAKVNKKQISRSLVSVFSLGQKESKFNFFFNRKSTIRT
jgi:hypothetical protein